MLQLGLLSD